MNADNLVVLNGRLTKEVDLRYSQNGNAVARFAIAVNRSRKESDGSRLADFHNCVAFHKTAEIIADHFRKGSMIGIVGELQDNNYEKDGIKHYNKQIVVDTFGFRESRTTNENRNSDQRANNHDTEVSDDKSDNYAKGNQNGSNQFSDSKNDMPDFNRNNNPFGGSSFQSDGSDGLPF